MAHPLGKRLRHHEGGEYALRLASVSFYIGNASSIDSARISKNTLEAVAPSAKTAAQENPSPHATKEEILLLAYECAASLERFKDKKETEATSKECKRLAEDVEAYEALIKANAALKQVPGPQTT